ncbi:hypothetical protein [Roseobacter litoralis]|uniref:hypothetical protein n=1 Tax=Roseobacter litoralis TaxID=42443 RepID=UPI0024947783|nr:hypothetical protein [Roseobacter litoralis]
MASRSAAWDAAKKSPTHRSTQPRTCAVDAHQAEIQRITEARDKVAELLTEGLIQLAPIFQRLEAELEILTAQEDTLARARRIVAENAAPKRAA